MTTLFRHLAVGSALVLAASGAAWAVEAMDHAALAAQYEQEAKDARAKAQVHKEMEKHYDATISNPKSGFPKTNAMKNHCQRLVSEYTEIANDAEALAKEHRAAAAAEAK